MTKAVAAKPSSTPNARSQLTGSTRETAAIKTVHIGVLVTMMTKSKAGRCGATVISSKNGAPKPKSPASVLEPQMLDLDRREPRPTEIDERQQDDNSKRRHRCHFYRRCPALGRRHYRQQANGPAQPEPQEQDQRQSTGEPASHYEDAQRPPPVLQPKQPAPVEGEVIGAQRATRCAGSRLPSSVYTSRSPIMRDI